VATKYLDLTKCSVFVFYIKDILISPAAGKESEQRVNLKACLVFRIPYVNL
jgi:hypothetical protein